MHISYQKTIDTKSHMHISYQETIDTKSHMHISYQETINTKSYMNWIIVSKHKDLVVFKMISQYWDNTDD